MVSHIRKQTKSIWIVLLFSILLFSLFLNELRVVHVDEPWLSIPAYTLTQGGGTANPVLSGRHDYLGKHLLAPVLAHTVMLAAGYKLLGLSLLVGRLISVAWAVLAVYFLYRTVLALGLGERVATLAALLASTDTIVFIAARTIRPDMMSASLSILTFAMLIEGLKSNSKLHIGAAGALAGFGLYTHPVFAISYVAFLVILLFRHKCLRQAISPIVLFIAFSALSLLPYIAYVIIEDASTGFSHFLTQLFIQGPPTALSGSLSSIVLAEFQRWTRYYLIPERMPVAIITFVVVLLGFKRWRVLWPAYLVVFAHIVLLGLIFPNSTYRYLTAISFYFAIIIADVMIWAIALISQRLSAGKKAVAMFLLLTSLPVFFLNQMAGNIMLIAGEAGSDYYGVTRRIETNIPDDAKLWGSMRFWLGLYDHPYRTQYTYLRDFETFKPQFVVLDTPMTTSKDLRTFGTCLWEELEARGKMIDEFTDEHYGRITIYHLVWDPSVKVPCAERLGERSEE